MTSHRSQTPSFLLLQDTVYHPGYGASRGNRFLLERLASRGCQCVAVSRRAGVQASTSRTSLTEGGATDISDVDNTLSFRLNQVEVHAVGAVNGCRLIIAEVIARNKPDWVLVSSEDFGFHLLALAMELAPQKVVYLARTTQLLPFGPRAYYRSARSHHLLRRARAIIAVSHFIQDYCMTYGDIQAEVLALPSFEYPIQCQTNTFDNKFVTIINPCAVKGIDIFLAVASKMADIQFAAVPTWGTTKTDVQNISTLANVCLLKANADVNEIYAQTRVLLVPSLWDDAFPKVVIEAMACGIPVIASDVGGIPEAKLGVEYVVPVKPICSYTKEFDERMNRIPIVPPQNVTPWIDAIHALNQKLHYEEVSTKSRQAATCYISHATELALLDRLAVI